MLKIEDLRLLCNDETVIITKHTFDRMRERSIIYEDITQAIMNGEIIEQYPDDSPYPSCLILGLSVEVKQIHIVVGLGNGELWVITAYYPTLNKWENDYKTRKVAK